MHRLPCSPYSPKASEIPYPQPDSPHKSLLSFVPTKQGSTQTTISSRKVSLTPPNSPDLITAAAGVRLSDDKEPLGNMLLNLSSLNIDHKESESETEYASAKDDDCREFHSPDHSQSHLFSKEVNAKPVPLLNIDYYWSDWD